MSLRGKLPLGLDRNGFPQGDRLLTSDTTVDMRRLSWRADREAERVSLDALRRGSLLVGFRSPEIEILVKRSGRRV